MCGSEPAHALLGRLAASQGRAAAWPRGIGGRCCARRGRCLLGRGVGCGRGEARGVGCAPGGDAGGHCRLRRSGRELEQDAEAVIEGGGQGSRYRWVCWCGFRFGSGGFGLGRGRDRAIMRFFGRVPIGAASPGRHLGGGPVGSCRAECRRWRQLARNASTSSILRFRTALVEIVVFHIEEHTGGVSNESIDEKIAGADARGHKQHRRR